MSKPSREFFVYYKYFKFSSAYSNILYDPYNKLYYRLGSLEIGEEAYSEPTNALSNPQDFVIIVSDEEFNILHEESFSQPNHGQYVPRMSFVSQTGLQIAFIDYEKEDILKFSTFNLIR